MLTECLPTKMDALRALIADDLADVDRLIKLRLYSEVALINQLSHYIVANGGKRLRPLAPWYALWHGSAAQSALLRVIQNRNRGLQAAPLLGLCRLIGISYPVLYPVS